MVLNLNLNSGDLVVVLLVFTALPSSRKRECDGSLWFTTHYDSVLEELYRAFRDSGEATFGNWFFQNGGFHHFVHFAYVYSVLSSKLFVQVRSCARRRRGVHVPH